MTGVQRPRHTQAPTQIKVVFISHCGEGGRGIIMSILSTMREPPAVRRNNRRPTPGLPSGKVEYRRCKRGTSKLHRIWILPTSERLERAVR
jgi:hypothetical protein